MPVAVVVAVMLTVMEVVVVAGLVELLFIQEDHFLPQLLIQSLLELVVLVLMAPVLQQEIMVEILFSLIQVLLEQ